MATHNSGSLTWNDIRVGNRKLPIEIYNACINRGLNVAQMDEMSGRQLFEQYCEWEGIIGYTNRLYSMVGELEAWDEEKRTASSQAPASAG